ncbi:MAG TPA: DUF2341 domain-containing protein [Candidatus Aenigmarchaeota archaeon]|nr:DUF2341 domain-containing protein [Candidatus Aenigmarchaeota archaeon]
MKEKIKKYVFGGIIILISLTLLFFPKKVYRKEITITEQAGINLEDYQIRIIVDTATPIREGKMNPDCSGIRFTWLTPCMSEEEIPHWIAYGCNTNETEIWFRVPFIPANSNVTVYMYYSRRSFYSPDKSDMNAVFYEKSEISEANVYACVNITNFYGG